MKLLVFVSVIGTDAGVPATGRLGAPGAYAAPKAGSTGPATVTIALPGVTPFVENQATPSCTRSKRSW